VTHLVAAVALAAELASDRPPVLLDIRWSLVGPPGREVFAQGHVPGAVYVDLDTDLADPPGPRGRHPLPDPARFARAMRRAGVVLDRPVVVMDGRDGSVAARAWWLLRHHGHDDVRLLDGGRKKWVDEGRPMPTDVPSPAAADYPVTERDDSVIRAYREQVLAHIGNGKLVDVRSPGEFSGELLHMPDYPQEGVLRGGHVPTAAERAVAARGQRRRLLQDRRRAARHLRGRARHVAR